MKTIMDAVNEFKGSIGDDTLIIIHDERGCYESGLPEIVNDFYSLTCSRYEFNLCVVECSMNHLSSTGIDCKRKLNEWQEGIKREGEACCVDCNHEWRCKLTEVETMACPNCGDKPQPRVNKPPKPVFTQAMADNGELPQVGMDVEINTYDSPSELDKRSWHKTRILSIDSDMHSSDIVTYTCKWSDSFYVDAHPVVDLMFRPIDTRTDTEKAIDCLDDFNLALVNGWQEDVIGFIKSGEFHGVKWVGE